MSSGSDSGNCPSFHTSWFLSQAHRLRSEVRHPDHRSIVSGNGLGAHGIGHGMATRVAKAGAAITIFDTDLDVTPPNDFTNSARMHML